VSYARYDEDPWADAEALENERFEADVAQADMEAEGARIARARRAGVCTHGSAVGYRQPPAYPEQAGLEPGQVRCTAGCGRVFDADADWHQAMADAVSGY
jgi:hypothetical protein